MPREISKLEFKFEVLLETLPIPCKYFQGDGDECLKADKYHDADEIHNTWNCDGCIKKCDLYDWRRKNLRHTLTRP
jgi:hypothetical protein